MHVGGRAVARMHVLKDARAVARVSSRLTIAIDCPGGSLRVTYWFGYWSSMRQLWVASTLASTSNAAADTTLIPVQSIDLV